MCIRDRPPTARSEDQLRPVTESTAKARRADVTEPIGGSRLSECNHPQKGANHPLTPEIISPCWPLTPVIIRASASRSPDCCRVPRSSPSPRAESLGELPSTRSSDLVRRAELPP